MQILLSMGWWAIILLSGKGMMATPLHFERLSMGWWAIILLSGKGMMATPFHFEEEGGHLIYFVMTIII